MKTMKKNGLKRFTCCVCMIIALNSFSDCHAEIEWQMTDTISLEEKPLDIAISKDGKTTYILGEEKILIFSAKEKRVTDTIPITHKFSQIEVTPDGGKLLLTDKEKKQISVIQVTKVYDIPIGQSPIIGNKDAGIHIFAFIDFQCPYCIKAYPVFEKLLEKYDGKVNLVIKHFPLRSHKFARKSGIAVLAAARQGKYKELTDLFFEKKKVNNKNILIYAEEVGLDMEQFEKDLNDPALNRIISEDVKLARRINVRSVPTLFVNGRLSKMRSVEAMSQMIDKELKKVKQ